MEEIIKRIAKKYDLPAIAVETMIRSQFKTVTNIMKEGEYKSIRLEGLGIFAVKPGRLDYYKHNKKEDE